MVAGAPLISRQLAAVMYTGCVSVRRKGKGEGARDQPAPVRLIKGRWGDCVVVVVREGGDIARWRSVAFLAMGNVGDRPGRNLFGGARAPLKKNRQFSTLIPLISTSS